MADLLQLLPTTFCNTQEDVVENVHTFADAIAEGRWGPVRIIVAVVETMDGKLTHLTIGKDCDIARAIGVMQMEVIRSSMGTN